MNKELFGEAMIGKDAEDFIKSSIGQFIIGCAEQESQEAVDQLKKVLPWRRRKIIELQNKIWRADNFQYWLAELVVRGKQAVQQLDNEEQ